MDFKPSRKNKDCIFTSFNSFFKRNNHSMATANLKKSEDFVTNTGCPINWYTLSISIPDFPDGPMKKS